MTTKPFTIALLQMKYAGSPQKQLAKTCNMLERAAKKGADVACLPELFLTDYFCQKIDPKNFDLAEPIDGPTVKKLCETAKKTKMVIIGSIYEKAAPGLYYNTAVIIEKNGKVIGTYRKMHIPHDPLFEEKYYFAPGDQGFKAHDTSAGKLGALVCWDQWYPEGARLTAMQGANVLFYPTAIGWHPKEKKEFGEAQVSAWETIQRSHAIANGVYVASVNRVGFEKTPPLTSPPQAGGTEGGLEFFGHSFICDPFGRMLAVASHDKEEIIMAKIDPALQEETRRNWPFFRDRRVDAYGDITKRFGC